MKLNKLIWLCVVMLMVGLFGMNINIQAQRGMDIRILDSLKKARGYYKVLGPDSVGMLTVWKGDIHFFMDTTGVEYWKEREYDYVEGFRCGMSRVSKDGIYFFIDAKGKEHFKDRKYNNVYSFHEGLAIVKKDGKAWFIDKEGKEYFKDKEYNWVSYFSEGKAQVRKGYKKWYIDKKGNCVKECENMVE